MAEFDTSKLELGLQGAGNIAGGLAGLGTALYGAYNNVPKARSNKGDLHKAAMAGYWDFGASDPLGLISQYNAAPVLTDKTSKDYFDPSQVGFGTFFGAGMSAYGTGNALGQSTYNMISSLKSGSVPNEQVTGDIKTTGGQAMSDSDYSQLVSSGGQNGVINPVSADTTALKFTTQACGGHLHGYGGHKFAAGGLADIIGNAAGLAMAPLGIGLAYAGIQNQKRQANMEATETNATNAYARQMMAHNFGEAAIDSKNNMFKMQALQLAMGGDLHTHGAEFPLQGYFNIIGAGGTHEQNPLGGVFQGMAPDGRPNLVEEDEVVWNDYVFSNRITIPKPFAKEYKLKEGTTYADAAKKLSKEAEERPNDPISQNGLEDIMSILMNSQEEVKAKREAARMKRQINQMSPDELAALGDILGQAEGQPFAYGGFLGHTFSGTEKGSSKMSKKQKAAAEEKVARENKSRLTQLLANPNMSLEGMKSYASTLEGYNADDYNTTAAKEKLANFIMEHGNYAKFNEHIKQGQEVKLLNTTPDFTESKSYDNSAYRAQMNRNNAYTGSSTKGVTNAHYAEDKTMTPTAREREATQDYQNKTRYVLDQMAAMNEGKAYNKEFMEDYLQMLDNTVAKGNNVPLLLQYENGKVLRDGNGNLKLAPTAVDQYNRLRTDGKGGTYHNDFVLPTETMTGTRTIVRMKGSDGTYQNIELTPEQIKEHPYLRQIADNTVQEMNADGTERKGYTTRYVDVEANPYETEYDEEEEDKEKEFKMPKQTISRYAPLLAGFQDQPQYDYSTGFAPRVADYAPIGDYLSFNPVDTQRYINANNQQSAAQLNAIMNASAGNRNMAMAQAALANGQRIQGIGNILQAAEAMNFDRRAKVGEFNRGTNMFNAQAHNAAEIANLQNNPLMLRQEQQNAAMRYRVDSDRDAAIGANRSAMLDSLANIGRENLFWNQAMDNDALRYKPAGSPFFQGKDAYVGACGGYLTLPKKNRRK